MKKFNSFTLLAASLLSFNAATVFSQEEEEASSVIEAGLDIYSSYIWRGAKFGSGPAFQPWVEAGLGNLAIGAWGSVNASTDEALEMDLYLGYEFDFGLSLAVTDYYFGIIVSETEFETVIAEEYTVTVDGVETTIPADTSIAPLSYGFFDYDQAHYMEPMISYSIGDLSLSAAYMFAPGFEEGDMYFEAGYSIAGIDLAVGAGDGAYTDDGDFMLCNISVGTSKEISITESFSLPLSGAVVLNPSTEGFYITVGVSF